MSKTKDYKIVNWSELVYYDESSPSGLRWKINRFDCSGGIKAIADNVAGGMSDHGYWVIPNKSKYYKVHRIVWLLNFDTLDSDDQVDHINRNRSDNKISNLRKISATINRRNYSKQQNNTSGITGVRWVENVNKQNNWSSTFAIAQWHESGSKRVKYFSTKKYGTLEAFALACRFRENKLKELNLLGYGYTSNHGN